MKLSITATKLKNFEEKIIATNGNDTLTLFWSEHLGKFITEFNSKFFASSKTITSPLKKFNELANKHNCK